MASTNRPEETCDFEAYKHALATPDVVWYLAQNGHAETIVTLLATVALVPSRVAPLMAGGSAVIGQSVASPDGRWLAVPRYRIEEGGRLTPAVVTVLDTATERVIDKLGEDLLAGASEIEDAGEDAGEEVAK